jgi:hypothetical protein
MSHRDLSPKQEAVKSSNAVVTEHDSSTAVIFSMQCFSSEGIPIHRDLLQVCDRNYLWVWCLP